MPADATPTATAPRTGREFLDSLAQGGRSIYLDGERIADPLAHPALREGAHSLARLLDFAAAPEHREVMCFRSPDTGGPVWRGYQVPRPWRICGPSASRRRPGPS